MPIVIHQLNPIAFQIGSLTIHWYGILYALGIILGASLVYPVAKRRLDFNKESYSDLLSNVILGIVLGARIGYIIFYDPIYFWQNPLEMFKVWEGGLSYHGGAIGALVACVYFAKREKKSPWRILDLLGMGSSVAVISGRIGNFINAELIGRVTQSDWSVIFTQIGPEKRHPSQLYEALTEGLILAIFLFAFEKRNPKPGILFGIYLLAYGLMRFLVEFIREPDPQLGLVFGPLSMGQLLCSVMVILGTGIIIRKSYE